MQSGKARAAIGAGTIALIVVLFIVLSGGDDDTGPSTTAARTTQTAATGPTTTTRTTTRPARPKPKVITVRGGKPVGGVQRLEYERGDRIRFVVRSDVADEVHAHGYDVSKEVAAGGRVSFSFTADLEGVFEVELESLKEQIAEIRVSP